ncbi:MAG: hypothetical protein HEQ39_09495 [Rhizobacter sp.]
MTTTIDTTPARLRELALIARTARNGFFPDERKEVGKILDAIAAEKEAQAGQEPFGFIEPIDVGYFEKKVFDAATVYRRQATADNEDATVPLYLAPQPSEPAPVDVPLPEPDLASNYIYDAHVYSEKKLRQYAKAVSAAELERITSLLSGIDKTEDEGGWWPTSAGAEFGAKVLAAVKGTQ